MKNCIHCGAPLHEEASFCHRCAKSQRESSILHPPRSRKKGLRIGALGLAAAIALGAWALWPREEAAPAGEPAPAAETPIHEAQPSTQPGPEIFDNGGAEIVYTSEGTSYRLLASFSPRMGEEARFLSGTYSREHSVSPGSNYMTFTHLFVVSDTGEFAGDDFAELVEEVRISARPAEGSAALEPSAPTLSPDDPHVFRLSGFYYNESNAQNELCWEIAMKNGDTVRLRQVFTVSTVEQLSLHYSEHSMATIEELRSLLESVSAGVSPETEVTIYLPPVVYEGGISFDSRSFKLVGSTDGETGTRTTFTDTVSVSAFAPTVSSLSNIDFVTEGRVGVHARESVWLEGCLFSGCSVGAYADMGGWLCTVGCSFVNNGVGMEINNPGSARLSRTNFTALSFEGNDLGFRLSACGYGEDMMFELCSFSGNGQDVECLTGNEVNYMDCSWE